MVALFITTCSIHSPINNEKSSLIYFSVMEHLLSEDHDFIELFKLLKIMSLVSSGGEAKMAIEASKVKVNGEIELQKRKKLRKGDTVDFNGSKIEIK